MRCLRTPPASAGRHPAYGALLALAAAAYPATATALRPFDSTDAAVGDRGQVEIELGPVGYVVHGSDRALVSPSLVLTWGVADRWEVALEGRHLVELGNEVEEPRSRVEDTGLSVKRVLREGALQEKSGPSIATELDVLLPTIKGEPGVGGQWALIASQRWRDLTVHLTGAVSWTRAHAPGAFGGVILEGHDAWVVHPVAELFVEGERDAPTTLSGLVGAIWRASDRLSFDAAARRARAGAVNTTEIRAGLTWSFSAGFPR